MNKLYIEQTRSTPEIVFDPATDKLTISGQSYPENAFKFYEPILTWLEEYLAGLEKQVVVELYFHMPYINTSSSKCIMMLLEKLEQAYLAGKQVAIKWYYDVENEVALECAEEFKEDLEIPFGLIPLEGEK